MKFTVTRVTILSLPAVAFLAAITSCSHERQNAGVCISFDDRSVREWSEMRPLLNSYNAKVTFFITQYDSLNPEERRILKDLESDGHEIGSHGALHVLAETYIKGNSYNDYLEKEIDASIAALKADGFNPTSFAYPYGSKYWLTDFLLLKRFEVLRNVAPYRDPIDHMDEIFYAFDGDKTLSAVGFDQGSGVSIENLKVAFDRALRNKEVLMLYAHLPENGRASYAFDLKLLEEILATAKKDGLIFYRCKDLLNSN